MSESHLYIRLTAFPEDLNIDGPDGQPAEPVKSSETVGS